MKKLFLILCIFASSVIYHTSSLYASPDIYARVYEKLDGVNWLGQNAGVAIEGLEKINPHAHIAATDNRIIMVWDDTIVANFPKPSDGDWAEYGRITDALVSEMYARDSNLASKSANELVAIGANSIIGALDENGRYIGRDAFDPTASGRILTSTGIFGGMTDDGFLVRGVYKGSPADVADIKPGEFITKINGADVSDTTDMVGFNSGTLKLQVGGRRVVLRRASVMLADADIVSRGEILEIIVHKVSENAVEIVNEALTKHSDLSGIILDLRTAAGDDPIAATKLAGLFVGRVPVLRVIDPFGDDTELVPGADAMTSAPVVIVVSDATTGTAEGLAAAFYENSRGVVIGTATAGRARIATRLDLGGGDAIKLFNRTIATGKGAEIDGRGVFPIVCLSNIRNNSQQGAFFLNVINGDFNARDFNAITEVPAEIVRKGCPAIVSGADEDSLATGVAAKILTDGKVYQELKK